MIVFFYIVRLSVAARSDITMVCFFLTSGWFMCEVRTLPTWRSHSALISVWETFWGNFFVSQRPKLHLCLGSLTCLLPACVETLQELFAHVWLLVVGKCSNPSDLAQRAAAAAACGDANRPEHNRRDLSPGRCKLLSCYYMCISGTEEVEVLGTRQNSSSSGGSTGSNTRAQMGCQLCPGWQLTACRHLTVPAKCCCGNSPSPEGGERRGPTGARWPDSWNWEKGCKGLPGHSPHTALAGAPMVQAFIFNI